MCCEVNDNHSRHATGIYINSRLKELLKLVTTRTNFKKP